MAGKPDQGTKLEAVPPVKPVADGMQPAFQSPQSKVRVIQEHGLAKYRIAAKLIDVIPLTFIELIVFFALFNYDPADPSKPADPLVESTVAGIIGFAIIWMCFAIIDVVYFFIFEYFAQATLGKKIFGLKVIDYIKGRPGARQILGRAILTAISIHSFLWVVELIVMLTDRNGLRIADHAAGTKVIRVRSVSTIPARVPDRTV